MKNFQQNLLIVLALCLCGLCTWQWNFQTVQRARLAEQNRQIFARDTDIQNYTNSLRVMDQKITQMDQRLDELKQSLAATNDFIIAQKREMAKLAASNDTLALEIVQYTNALAGLDAKLRDAYEGIKKQNANVETLVSQRDEFIQKYTNSAQERNDIVVKYNQVVDRLNKLQSAATNSPGR